MIRLILATLTMVIGVTAPAQSNSILIEGAFGSADGCNLAIRGVLSSGTTDNLPLNLQVGKRIEVCVVSLKNVQFTNGATKQALSDGGIYYVTGVLTGKYFDQLQVSEVAGMNE